MLDSDKTENPKQRTKKIITKLRKEAKEKTGKSD